MSKARFDMLGQQGMQALQNGQYETARDAFSTLIQEGGGDTTVWLVLGVACQQAGDSEGALVALDKVLNDDPINLRALLMKGDILQTQGDRHGAATFYKLISQAYGDTTIHDPAVAQEVVRASRMYSAYEASLAQHLLEHLRQTGTMGTDLPTPPRFDKALGILTQSGQRWPEMPRAFYFPELPPRPFYEREEFIWTHQVESQMAKIKAELDTALTNSAVFDPYIHASGNTPIDPNHPLLNRDDWSALFLIQNGTELKENSKYFPETMKVLEKLPLERVSGRAPSVLISRLRAGTVIAPHTGFLNTRLTCHLPLIIPDKCGIQVGGETRHWQEGQMLILNDAIEHHAWNNSQHDRFVLIFQVWRPELSDAERRAVAHLLEGIDTF